MAPKLSLNGPKWPQTGPEDSEGSEWVPAALSWDGIRLGNVWGPFLLVFGLFLPRKGVIQPQQGPKQGPMPPGHGPPV